MFGVDPSRDLFDLVTLIAGILGCATGFISLWMQITNKPRLKIQAYAPKVTGFMDNLYCTEKRYKSSGKIALIPLSIINLKPLDTSIYHIEMIYNGNSTTYDSQYKVSKIVDSQLPFISSQLLNSNGQITLPYRLHGMETVNLLLTFPYVQDWYKEYKKKGDPMDVTVCIHTSTKIIKYHTSLADIKVNVRNLTC